MLATHTSKHAVQQETTDEYIMINLQTSSAFHTLSARFQLPLSKAMMTAVMDNGRHLVIESMI